MILWLESILKLVGLPFKKFAHLAHNKNKVLLLYTIVKRRRLPWQYFTDAIFHNLFRFCNIILRILNWFSTYFSFLVRENWCFNAAACVIYIPPCMVSEDILHLPPI